jgi:hypothetical protein
VLVVLLVRGQQRVVRLRCCWLQQLLLQLHHAAP